MENIILEDYDKERIEKLIEQAVSIKKIYTKLCELESNNKKETEDYKKELECLKSAIELEQKTYLGYQDLTTDKCYQWLRYLLKQRTQEVLVSDMESVMTHDYNNIEIRRVAGNLGTKIASDIERTKKIILPEMKKTLANTGREYTDEFISHSIYSSRQLQNAFNKDLYNAYLLMLKQYIDMSDMSENENEKKYLITSKYNLSYIKKEVEKNMINNNFNINNELYTNSQITSDLYCKSSIPHELVAGVYGIKLSDIIIKKMLEVGDVEYNNLDTELTVVFRQCFLRGLLSLLNDDLIAGINNNFYSCIESQAYLEKHSEDKMSRRVVAYCFQNVKKDKEKILTLSLRPQK